MNLLRGKSTRIYYSSAGVLTDITSEMQTFDTPDKSVTWIASQDALYFGSPHKFNWRYIKMATGNTNAASLTAEYWSRDNGWQPFKLFIDETSGLKSSGFIQWEDNRPEWVKQDCSKITEVASLPYTEENDWLFWMRLKLSSDSSAMTLSAIKYMLSDDRMMTAIHPEIFSYLPANQTDYLKQHELAKDFIVAQLKQRGVIAYEEQIKNPDEWLMAATYRTIALILAPIPGDDKLNLVKKEMASMAEVTSPGTAASIDTDRNEDLDPQERQPGQIMELGR